MDLMQGILTRRAIRSFTREPVAPLDLEKIMEAGSYAPSGMGSQSAKILAVTEPALREKLSKLNAAVMGGADDDPYYHAPVVLVVLASRDRATCVEDGALVLGNMMLAAHALGLGSCWIHREREMFETEEGRALLRERGITDDYIGVGAIALGHIDGEPPQAARRKPDFITRA